MSGDCYLCDAEAEEELRRVPLCTPCFRQYCTKPSSKRTDTVEVPVVEMQGRTGWEVNFPEDLPF